MNLRPHSAQAAYAAWFLADGRQRSWRVGFALRCCDFSRPFKLPPNGTTPKADHRAQKGESTRQKAVGRGQRPGDGRERSPQRSTVLYYWRGDNYRRDLDHGAGYPLNQSNPFSYSPATQWLNLPIGFNNLEQL